MAFFKLGTLGLLIQTGMNIRSLPLPDPIGGEGPVDGLTHSLSLEYVDGSGVLQSVTATPGSGATITLPLGSKLWLDASASRSVATDADTEGEAWTGLGHRFDSGETLAETWSLAGTNKNVTTGAGISSFVYKTSGTFTLRHWIRDTAGRQSLLTVTVTVPALAAGTDISVGGSWPAFTSNTVYNLAAGTDHSAKGVANLTGLHNVVFRKTGGGADPIIAGITLHATGRSNTAQTRTRGCRTIGIDVAVVNEGRMGSLYCGVVLGRCRRYEPSPTQYFWENEASTQNEKDNIRFARGFTFWDSGETNSNSTNYVNIDTAKNLTMRNADFRKTTGDSGQHVFRGWFEGLDMQYCRLRSSVNTSSYCKITGADNGATFDAWPSDDKLGVWNGALYRPVCRKIVLAHNIYGAAGNTEPSAQDIEICPENGDTGSPDQAIELASLEDNVWYLASATNINAYFGGRHILRNNNKANLGAGGEMSYVDGTRYERVPLAYQGPYKTTARPVVIP